MGSRFGDRLTGDSAPLNVLVGGAGDDRLTGGRGVDLLIPGAGNDRVKGGPAADLVTFPDATSGVSADLGHGIVTGGAGSDRISGVEAVGGSPYADVLQGTSAANVFFDDPGDDHIVGGGGPDALVFAFAPTSVIAGLGFGRSLSAYDGSDTFSGLVGLVGSRFNDQLYGDAGPNLLMGEAGNDFLDGKGGGDILNGGPGRDRCLNGSVLKHCESLTAAQGTAAGASSVHPPLPPGGAVAATRGARGLDDAHAAQTGATYTLGEAYCNSGQVTGPSTEDPVTVYTGSAYALDTVYLREYLYVWNGQAWDGPVQTSDLLHSVASPSGQTVWLNNNELSSWITFSPPGPGYYRVALAMHWQAENADAFVWEGTHWNQQTESIAGRDIWGASLSNFAGGLTPAEYCAY